jgi:hypothetical protein
MKSGFAIVHRITQTEFDVDLGASLSAGFIEIVDASGQPTGAVYMTGVPGIPATQINESMVTIRTAVGDINHFRVVYDIDGVTCGLADPTDVAKCNAILGVTLSTVQSGGRTQIVSHGEIAKYSGLGAGEVYLGTDGTLTSSVPTTGVFVKIGRVANTSLLMVKLERSILLS